MMMKVLARKRDGCTTYTTLDGERLFQGSVEPRNYWNSVFARLKGVEFSIDGGTFTIGKFAFDQIIEIANGGPLFGWLRYKGSEGITLQKKDGATILASSPQGWATTNRTYECRAPDGKLLFEVRCPTVSEFFGTLLHWDFRMLGCVGAIAPESMKDPAVAILFMFIEMFVSYGYAEGA